MSNLPSFEEMRRNAYRLLGDAQDELYSDWRPDAAPNGAQREAARKALRAIAKAKGFLNDAASPSPSQGGGTDGNPDA